jgi:hypothetical protein
MAFPVMMAVGVVVLAIAYVIDKPPIRKNEGPKKVVNLYFIHSYRLVWENYSHLKAGQLIFIFYFKHAFTATNYAFPMVSRQIVKQSLTI